MKRLACILAGSLLIASCDSGSSTDAGSPKKVFAYDTLRDARDGQAYNAIKIGTQTWMAQNLNYSGAATSPIGTCYRDSAKYCSIAGRLYKWTEANGLATRFDTAYYATDSQIQGVCPSGWHVPTLDEWWVLIRFVGGEFNSYALQSDSNWTPNYGQDTYGFHARPTGQYNLQATTSSGFANLSAWAFYWANGKPSDRQYDSIHNAYFVSLEAGYNRIEDDYGSKYNKLGIRCLKNP